MASSWRIRGGMHTAPKHKSTINQETQNLLDVLDNLAPHQGALLVDGDKPLVVNNFSAEELCKMLKCHTFQMVPCMKPPFAGYELWLDEEGAFHKPVNRTASNALHKQVHGEILHGNVLVVATNTIG